MKKRNIIIQPVVSEKSFSASELGVYMFRVDRKANKNQIKDEVEKLFNVTVEKVNVVNQRGKAVYDWSTRRRNNRKDYKKAIVTLKAGDTIDIFKT